MIRFSTLSRCAPFLPGLVGRGRGLGLSLGLNRGLSLGLGLSLSLGLSLGLPVAGVAQPTLTGRLPAANAPAGSRTAAMQLTFSAPMTAATATAAAVKVSSQQRGYRAGAATFSGGGTATVTVAPAPAFRPGELVTTTVTTAAQRLSDGAALAQGYVYQFRAAAATAPGTFAVAPAISTGSGSPRGQAAADYNHDGNLDFAVAYFNLNQAQLFLGNGAGGFAAGATYATGTGPVAMATADIDNDGDADLLTVNRTNNTVTVAKNGGAPAYTLAVSSTLNLGGGSLAQTMDMGDLDGDGDVDLVVTRLGADRVGVYLNNGSGTFSAGTALTVSRPYAVRLADLDNDGDLDLLATQRQYLGTPAVANTLFVFANTGSATFTALPSLTVGAESYDVQAADVDNDGDNDLLAVSIVAEAVDVRLNNGVGGFSGTQRVGVGSGPSSIAVADLDGDGDLDFATANTLTISIRRNDGLGNFSGTMEVPTYDDPFTIMAGDVDNDLDLDLLVNNTTTRSESVLLNQVLRDTTISTTQTLVGSYRNVTITGTGHVTLGAALGVLGTCHVQPGGELDPLRFMVCSAGAFRLDAGATLHCAAAGGLTASGLAGPVQTAGSRLMSTDGTYVYDGLSGAQVTGAGLPATVRALTASAPGGLTLSQPLGVRRLLHLAGATNLQLAAHDLTLLSTSAHTAMLVQPGAGAVQYGGTGRAVVQRSSRPATAYAGRAYRHYSAAVQGATVADLDVPTRFAARVNPAYNALPTPTAWTYNAFPNVFGYDEARLTPPFAAFDTGWYSPAARPDLLLAGRGYTVHLPANARLALRGQLYNGALSTGALSCGPTAASGWHLLGNPYAAPLDWNVVRTTPGALPAGLDDAVAVWEPAGADAYDGVYRYFVNGMGTLPGGLLPLMQGFFVHCSAPVAAPGFTFQNAFRATAYADPRFARPVAMPRPTLTLALANAVAPPDELVVYWQTGATAAFDGAFDARKLVNPGRTPSLAAVSVATAPAADPAADRTAADQTAAAAAGGWLAVQGLPLQEGLPVGVVPLAVRAGAAGPCSLALTAFAALPANWPVWLEDRLTGRRHDLRAGAYAFVSAGPGPLLSGRFWLHVGQAQPTRASAEAAQVGSPTLAVWPNPAAVGSSLHLANLPVTTHKTTVTLTFRDLLQQPVRTLELPLEAGQETLDLPLTGLQSGAYLLTAQPASGLPQTLRVWLD